MKAALYIRVSTHHQIDKDSLPFQRKELVNYAQYALGITDFEVFEDAGYSAKNTDRPAFQKMFSKIRMGEFTHLLVWKIDRISRNLRDFSEMYDELKDCNVTFVSKNEQFDTSSAMGEAMLKIILVFAELERKITAERVYSIMLSRAEKGLWNGANCPIGYVWDEESKFPIISLNEAKIIKYIFDNYEQTKSALQVMKLLNGNGFKTKRGGEWGSKTVVDIIRNPFYKGTYRYNYRESGRGKIKDEKEWVVIDHNHSPIISPEQWDRCNTVMDINAERNTSMHRGNVHTHIFSSLMKCAHCGHVLIAGIDRPRKDGYTPSKYRCQNRMRNLGCQAKMASDDKIGDFVLSYIANLIRISKNKMKKFSLDKIQAALLSGACFKNVDSIERKTLEQVLNHAVLCNGGNIDLIENLGVNTTAPNQTIEYELLLKEKNKIERALDRLKKLYLFDDEAMSEKDYLVQKKEFTSQLEVIQKKLKALTKENPSYTLGNSIWEEMNTFMIQKELIESDEVSLKELLKKNDKDTIKEFINTLISEIVVTDGKVESILFSNGFYHKFIYKP